ncbi:SDR family oxidoreductase [Polycyclovorans algicola]|uniref:SDR family oxidoreductase n=1 Tax=Polycyclovorans algicola TaxID=616992 RepID=UPI000A51574B|nr:SDR family oxidoreductase [Polycyclovorans algicola]
MVPASNIVDPVMGPTSISHHYQNRVVVISGGSSGIGLGISHHLATLGATVVIFGRSQDKLDAATAAIAGQGGNAVGYSVDVRDAPGIVERLADVAQQHGPLDLVIAAAAGNFFAPADKLSANGFKTVIDIDLIGTFNVFSAALPHTRKPGGVLLAITAPQAQRAIPNQAHACAAKAGIDMLVKCLALEWGAKGVRVNAVSPGPIAGTEGLARLSATPEIETAVRNNTALKAFGEVSDIARAVAYLGSPDARYVTGTILDCDGGMRLGNFPSL